MKTSYIYIISDREQLKVGVSVNPEKRLKQLQTGNPKDLNLEKTYKLPRDKVFKLEKEAHTKIHKLYSKNREWFMTDDVWALNFIIGGIIDSYVIEDEE